MAARVLFQTSARSHGEASMGERILLSGGCGFIGSHLVRALLGAGHRVTVLDDLSTGALTSLPASPHLEFVQGSILDPVPVTRAARGVDAVVHLAGVVGMRLATERREEAHRVAAEGTRRLLEATGDAPALLVSSSAVYGLGKGGPVREEDAAGPGGCLQYDGGLPGYASGKLALEAAGAEHAARGRPVRVLRPFNVVGPGQSAAYGMVLPTFVRRALEGRPLVVHDDGEQTRTFSDVRTFVACAVRLLSRPEAWSPTDLAVNVGATTPIRIGELARLVVEETGAEVPVEFVPYHRAFPGRRDVRAREPDVSRLRSLLGPVEWPGMREIVRDVVAWRRALAPSWRATVPPPRPAASGTAGGI